jgi:hypothetical protein
MISSAFIVQIVRKDFKICIQVQVRHYLVNRMNKFNGQNREPKNVVSFNFLRYFQYSRTTKLRFCLKVDLSKPCKHFQSIFNNEQSFTKISIVVVEMARSHSIKEKKKK